MQFLKTLFWVLVAVVLALFANRNWTPMTLNLWGDIAVDIKTPVLLIAVFLLGLVPTWIVMRAKVWGLQRRLEALERTVAPPPPAPASSSPAGAEAPLETEGMHA